MKFVLTPSFNDGKADAPPTEVDLPNVPADRPGMFDTTGFDGLADAIYSEMVNDNGEPFGVGFTLKIERIA